MGKKCIRTVTIKALSQSQFEISRTNIIFLLIVGFGAGAFVLQIIRSMITGETLLNALTCLAFLLHILSLLAFLFRKLAPLLSGFTFALFIVSIIFINDFIAYAALLVFLSLLAMVFSISSITSDVSAELLGRLYTWIFLTQLLFYASLVYIDRTGIKIKGIILFLDVIMSSMIICEFDQRIRFGDSCFAKVSLGKNTHASSFLYVIESILRRTVHLVKPVIEDLDNSIFLGILTLLLLIPLAPLIPIPLISAVSSFVAAIVFLVMIGARLRRECNIDLMIRLLPISLRSKKGFIFTTINLLLFTITAYLVYRVIALLNQPLLLTIVLSIFVLSFIFIVLTFIIPFMLAFAVGNIIVFIGGHLPQYITDIIEGRLSRSALPLTESNIEVLILNLAFSSSVFMALTLFILITCLRHCMNIKQRAKDQGLDLQAPEPGHSQEGVRDCEEHRFQTCSGSGAVRAEEGEPRRSVERDDRSSGERPRHS